MKEYTVTEDELESLVAGDSDTVERFRWKLSPVARKRVAERGPSLARRELHKEQSEEGDVGVAVEVVPGSTRAERLQS